MEVVVQKEIAEWIQALRDLAQLQGQIELASELDTALDLAEADLGSDDVSDRSKRCAPEQAGTDRPKHQVGRNVPALDQRLADVVRVPDQGRGITDRRIPVHLTRPAARLTPGDDRHPRTLDAENPPDFTVDADRVSREEVRRRLTVARHLSRRRRADQRGEEDERSEEQRAECRRHSSNSGV